MCCQGALDALYIFTVVLVRLEVWADFLSDAALQMTLSQVRPRGALLYCRRTFQ